MSRDSFDVKDQYTGTGAQSAYTFDFKIEALAQLLIIELDASNVETQRVLGTDVTYLSSVAFDPIDGAGTVNLTANLTTNYTLIILLANDAPTQPFGFSGKREHKLKQFEKAYDFVAGAVQRLAYKGLRTITMHEFDDESTFDLNLPPGIDAALGQSILVNLTGDGLKYGPTEADLAATLAAAAAALVSATNAATSETNAGISETNAAASETAAGISETNAGTSETNAAASEAAAAVSETNAAASAALLNILTTKGDLIVQNATIPIRIPVGADGLTLTADSTTASGLSYQSAASASSPTTTKGDIEVRDAAGLTRHGVGTNGEVLTANSTDPNGIEWAAPVNVSPTTTKGDLEVRDASAIIRKAVGTNDQILVADSADASGVAWKSVAASTIVNTPAGNIAATDVQAAITELDSEKVAGPATATDNAVPRYDLTTGKLVQDSGVIIDDSDNITGVNNLTVGGDLTVSGTTTTVDTATLDVTDANITVNNGGNQATANTNDAGITVEMSDATDAVIGYDSTMASKFAVGEVGALKEIADISSAQVITNKDNDGGTASNSNRLTIPKDTTTNLDALTDKEATIAYDTTLNTVVFNTGTEWSELSGGGGGSKNYIDNNDFESGIVGWDKFDDVTAYIDGTGGTSANLTISQNTTTPLAGGADFKIVKGAADAQYEGVSVLTETIDKADYGRTLHGSTEVDFTDAAYVSGDMKLFAYDVTNSAILPVINDDDGDIPASQGKVSFKILTTTTTASVRLSVMVNSTNASAYTVYLDDVKLGPDSAVITTIMSDWESFTPTGTWSANTTYFGMKRRVGDSMEMEILVETSGVPTGTFSLDIPDSKSIDTTKITSTSIGESVFGVAGAHESGVTNVIGNVTIGSTTSLNIVGQGGAGLWSATVPVTFLANDRIRFRAVIPIVGWSSGALLSTTEASQLNHAASGYMVAASVSTTSSVPLKIALDGTKFNIGDILDTVNDKITVKKSGRYLVSGSVGWSNSATGKRTTYVRLNGANEIRTMGSDSGSQSSNVCVGILDLVAGDYLELWANQTSGGAISVISNSGLETYLHVTALPDLSTFGVYGEYDYNEIVLAADYKQSSPTAATYYVPNSAFKIDLPSAGTYRIKLTGLVFPDTSSAAIGNMITSDIYLATNSTADSSGIIGTFTAHNVCFVANNLTADNVEFTVNDYTVNEATSIYVKLKWRVFSGSPTITNIGFRAESGAGNGQDPVLSYERLR